MFKNYSNINGKSNIEAYEIGDTCIAIKFFDTDKIYTYSYNSAGRSHVENMKALARRGYGLNSYINTKCRTMYVK